VPAALQAEPAAREQPEVSRQAHPGQNARVSSPRPHGGSRVESITDWGSGAWRAGHEVLCWLLPAIALAIVWFVFVAHLPQSDYLVFLRAGGAVVHGRDPYPPLGTSAVYSGNAFVYPWLAAWPFAPFALIGGHAADIAYFVVEGTAVVVGCRIAGLRDPVSIVLVLAAATTIRGFQVGSLNALLFLGCIMAWRFRNRRLGAVPLTAVIAAKLFLLPLLLWLVLARRWALLGWTLGGVGAVLAASFVLGPLSGGGYLKLLGALSVHESTAGFSLYGLITEDQSPTAARLICAVLAAGLILLGLWAVRGPGQSDGDRGAGLASLGRRQDGFGELALFGAAICAALVLTPILWSHYIVLAFVPIVLSRPPRFVLAAASLITWFVAQPASTPFLFELRDDSRVVLLYAALVVMVAVLAIRARSAGFTRFPGSDRPTRRQRIGAPLP
jgi:alpha-1,2-mannosyltransferase